MAKLKSGSPIPISTDDCEAVDNLPVQELENPDGTLLTKVGETIMAAGKLLLSGRKDDYIALLMDNGLEVCEDEFSFCQAGAPVRLRLRITPGGPGDPGGGEDPLSGYWRDFFYYFVSDIADGVPGAYVEDGYTDNPAVPGNYNVTANGSNYRLVVTDSVGAGSSSISPTTGTYAPGPWTFPGAATHILNLRYDVTATGRRTGYLLAYRLELDDNQGHWPTGPFIFLRENISF